MSNVTTIMNTNGVSGQTRQMANSYELNQRCFGRKYVALCLICGIMSSVVGSIIIIIYAVIRSNTSSLQYFETVPTYIPAILLIFNGLVVLSLTKNELRVAIVIKLIGILYLICGLLSVVMTVTTTVIHMNRLQTYEDCSAITPEGTCVCVTRSDGQSPHQSSHQTSHQSSIGNPMIFHSVPNCKLIHSLLSSCLRALFGLSVVAILISIFSLMLVYQLLSHQKKKKYLQQLEIRRRFHVQNRGFGPHSSHPSFVSPQLLSRNRNNSLRHMAYGYCDEVIANGWTLPPHSYDNLDSRSYNRSFDEDIHSSTGVTTNRSHSWTNWLNWSRNQVSVSNNLIPNQSTNRRFFNFLRRNRNNTRDNQNCWPNNHTFLPPHVFIPRIGSGGLTGLPPHLTRYRDSHMRRTLLTPTTTSCRRTRSNDGIFQHMNVHNIPIDQSSYNPNTNGSTNIFALWGPPPPYTCSQPQNLNRINTICNNINHSSISQRCRESSVHSSEMTPTSKMSTPQSERRLRCNAFSSEGIRLKIEGSIGSNDFLKPESKSSCIVEIHVPYSEEEHIQDKNNHLISDLEELRNSHKNSKLSFNTMPSMKKNEQHLQAINPFKSLSNIPTLPNGLTFDSKLELSDSELESNKSKMEIIQKVYRSQHFQQKSSLSSSTLNSTSNTSSEMDSNVETFANTDVSFSANSLPVDPPSDYKSTLFIQTMDTQSSPLTDKTSNNMAQRQAFNSGKDIGLNGAQSMPNLSLIIPISSSQSTSTRTHPIYRIPSSGNTSTSQDLADYELDLDEESIKFVADFPHDCLKTKLNSNSLDSSSKSQTDSQTTSITPELIKPPTPFNNQDYTENTTSSTATLSSLSDTKPELIINIKGIEV